ncbi:MAG: fumarylacetoacetate hydrolase family protein [Anderseniella sp.]
MSAETERLAKRLWSAKEEVKTCLPADDFLDSGDVETAYMVQTLLTERSRISGREQIGWKVGLTSKAALQAFQTKEPMVGNIYADTLWENGATVDAGDCIQPLIEGELLFQLAYVPDPNDSDEQLTASLAKIYAAFEIAECRIEGWAKTIAPAIADNACCGHLVIGEGADPAGIDMTAIPMRLMADGEHISNGSGAACLGNPLNVYRWLLEFAARTGRKLAAGDYILTGAMGPAQPMQAGTQYDLTLGGVGTARLITR